MFLLFAAVRHVALGHFDLPDLYLLILLKGGVIQVVARGCLPSAYTYFDRSFSVPLEAIITINFPGIYSRFHIIKVLIRKLIFGDATFFRRRHFLRLPPASFPLFLTFTCTIDAFVVREASLVASVMCIHTLVSFEVIAVCHVLVFTAIGLC